MADINVTINPAPSVSATVSAAPEVDVTIGDGIPKHAVTHAPGGSDSLEAYYATTGSLAYVSGLTTGIGNTGYLTGYVSKTETGDFYPASNPSGFITGVDLSNYVTGQVVRPSETGDFITNSETGVFYPTSNPSGFITGVDLSSYATTVYVTGVSGSLQTQITNLNNSTGSYVTGSVVRPSETGVFVTTDQTGQFVTGSVVRPSQTGAFLTTGAADSRYALSSATGVFITTSQTGVFASQSYVTGVSGHLQTQITTINNQTGNFVLKSATGNFITTSQTGQFVGTSQTGYYTGIFYPYNSNPLGYVQGAVVRPSQTGAFLNTGAADGRYVGLTGDQTISGIKNFDSRPTVNGTGVLLSGEGGAAANTGELTGVFYPLNSNPSGYITGVDLSSYATQSFVTGVSGHLQGQVNTLNGQTGNYVTGSVVRPSETGNFITTGQTGVFVTGSVVRPSETGDFVTTSQTGAFYPASNPSGFITGVDLSSYATTVYVTGVSGHLQNQINNLDNATGSYVTGDVVRPSETGDFVTTAQTGVFYPASNPSGYITGVDLSAYVTGDVVRPSETGAFLTTGAADSRYALQSETGSFITSSQTGAFYPASNPSGFITGVDLSAYVTGDVVRPSETGDFVTTSQTGVFVTGDVVRPSETGVFLTTGAADGRYALQSATGDFITTAQTGAFYPISNPSGFITGVDLSSYATQSFVTGISGDLQTKLNTVSGYAVTGYDDSITGISVTGNSTKTITLFQRDGGNLSASFTDASGALLENVVYTTGNQRISGIKTFANSGVFESDVSFSGKLIFDTSHTGEVLDGEASWDSEYGTLQIGMNNGDVINPVGFRSFYRVKANQNIGKGKVVMAVGAVGNSEFLLAQEAANIGSSGELIMGVSAEAITAGNFGDITAFGAVKGVDTSSFASGAILYFDTSSTGGFTQVAPEAPNAKVVTALNVNPSANGTVFVRVSAGSVLGGTDSNVKFTALQDNNFIAYSSASGIWYNKTLTTGDVSGISNYVLKSETGNFITTSQTGQFVGDSETGAFLTTGAADGRYALQSETGVFVTTGQTGQFVTGAVVRPTETGAFLTTGAADSRYALQSATGNFITTAQTGQFYPTSNPSGYITGVDLSVYVTGAVVRPSETGAFLTTGAADNRYALQSATGNFITTAQTGQFVSTSSTGEFLTTGAADARYYGLANGQSISGYAITGYNDAVTGISISGDATKTITLFQRDGTAVSGSFTDNGGSVSNVVYTTGDQIISGAKTFTGRLIAATGFFGTSNRFGPFVGQAIGGGSNNLISGNFSVIAGGINNTAINDYATIAGGALNYAVGSGTVGGGLDNNAGNIYTTIAGGYSNNCSASGASIGGGYNNELTNIFSTIAGGLNNTSNGTHATIGGGLSNTGNGNRSVIAGGAGNVANAFQATIGGGQTNIISGSYATIGGGLSNKALGAYATVAGGESNEANNTYSTVAGGVANKALNGYTTIPGGYGAKAHAIGQLAYASNYFANIGDGQYIQHIFYGISLAGAGAYLSPSNNGFVDSIFEVNQAAIALLTIQVLGFDDDDNFSQAVRKVVVRKLSPSYNEEISHIESIGTDVTNAGSVSFGIYSNIFGIFVDSDSLTSNTRWMANIQGIYMHQPPAYP